KLCAIVGVIMAAAALGPNVAGIFTDGLSPLTVNSVFGLYALGRQDGTFKIYLIGNIFMAAVLLAGSVAAWRLRPVGRRLLMAYAMICIAILLAQLSIRIYGSCRDIAEERTLWHVMSISSNMETTLVQGFFPAALLVLFR